MHVETCGEGFLVSDVFLSSLVALDVWLCWYIVLGE